MNFQSALLQEVSEEYEQMTVKMKEASAFLDKLKTPSGKPKGLRDHLVSLEKLTADIHVNKSKLELASEKLEVSWTSALHFLNQRVRVSVLNVNTPPERISGTLQIRHWRRP